ncbi:MAG: hypothetical protein JO251_11620, partial [Verrucomicrobia bacterium]|nr:hypothetical protein [Verrucomicrobiota bacterium]
MRRIDIFVSSPADVQKERSVVERLIRSVAAEFNVPVTVSYSNWLRRLSPSDKAAALSANGSEDGRSLLCPCFWEYQDFKAEKDYRERIPNTGQYDLVICILWSRLGTKISPAFVMPDGSQPTSATEYEIAWVLDQIKRTPGFPELHVYRSRATPAGPLEPKEEREISFEHWDSVQDFFATWGRSEAFANACRDYNDLQEFEELFREHFRAFVEQQLGREIIPRKRQQRAPYWKLNPYRGLQFFDYEHAAIFHGRTKAIGDVLDALKKQAIAKKPFVLVFGTKGAGKSSLVRAGVVPLLTEVGAANAPWRRAVTRPGLVDTAGDPFNRLATALLADAALPELEHAASHNGREDLASQLREHPDDVAVRLAEVLDQISLQELDRLLDEEAGEFPLPGRIEGTELARHRMLRRAKPKAHLALVVDQLEDLFAGRYSAELQHRYLAALVALVRCQRVFVIATLQSDFYANYQQFPELVQLAGANGRFDLQPPTREELGYVIRLPAAAAGLRFERDLTSGQSLDEALLDAAAANAEPLPLLEHVLSQLYQEQLARKDGLLRWSDYRDQGKFEGALAHHAEAAFTKLSDDEQGAFDFVMRHLASLGRGETGVGRAARYRELVSSPEFNQQQKAGAIGLVDCFIKEEFFTAEACSDQEMIVSITNEALLRKWPKFQLWLAEDQGFLRMRDRLDANLKLWLSRDRRCEDLLGPAFGVTDAETLLRHFRSALNKTEIDYIQKILEKQKHDRGRNTALSVIGAGVAVLAIVAGILWSNTDNHQKRTDELARFERRMEELAKEQSSVEKTKAWTAKEKAQIDPQNSGLQDSDFPVAQGSALEAQLALENDLKQAEEKAQLAQQNADLANTQRAAMEADLKKAEEKARLAQQNADLANTQRAAIEADLKKAEEKAQLAQQNADLATTQRAAMEADLKKAEEKAQLAQQNTDLATSQRATMEADLKKAEEKAQLAQQNADLATSQRAAMEADLKKAEEKAQLAQQNADLAVSQRAAMEADLKKAEEKAQQSADLSTEKRSAIDAELRKAVEKAQQAQQIADLAVGQRSTIESQLKMAEERAQLAQQNADLATTQRNALEAELKKAQERIQQAQQIAELALTQRNELDAELK